MKVLQKLSLLLFLVFGLAYAHENPKTSNDKNEGGSDDENKEGKDGKKDSSALGLSTSLLGLGAILAICLAK
ncbi:ECU01_0555 [Encephalitozoon cuniculi GB-M1]|uniref:ECU01_0555 protein n=1 Tax=Encephalitozoon cuniculi (strain GB-M1) TaxID=284813 RepID=I7JTZ1_ENCCU|nr:uncharacterized protein ECU01_0555 [Encephalitozoon cuniculi GB-M1]CCI73904.1 ECU01_0555 [Encephalitozoon cuniculi GB-M1]